MPKRILEMTALEVMRLRVEGSHAVGGATGLNLRVEGGTRMWVLRYVLRGSRRRMSLGGYPGVSLSGAREAARTALGLRDAGIDPLVARANKREAERLAVAQRLEFDKAAEEFIREHETTWRNLKHAQQWRNTLATYASPKFGKVWDEVDIETALWRVPANRMKSKKEHRVPLSRQAVALLKAQPRIELVDHVFPSNRMGALSDMALTTLMRRHKMQAVPHGFRSTFRDWAGETTHHPRDAVELCLAHAIDTKTEAAYRRADMLEKRAAIMQEWADYAAPALPSPAP